MHDTAYRIGGLAMATYLPARAAKILEVGAQNVNGTLRDHAPRNAQYIGLDFAPGEGVDKVITGLEDWDVPDAHFDLVIASSVFEHDAAFWMTFLAMCRKTKPGGYIYMSAPSNGTVHRYPMDCWRFYPDAALALETWARAEGLDATFVESFVAERENDGWNDFCAIFRMGPSEADLPTNFIHQQVACTNALNWRSSQLVNASEQPEDARLLLASRNEAGALRQEIESAHQQANSDREHLQNALNARIHELEANLAAHAAEIARLHAEATAAREETALRNAEIDELKSQAATGEAHLETHVARIQMLEEQILAERKQLAAQSVDSDRYKTQVRTAGEQLRAQTSEINRLNGRIVGMNKQLNKAAAELDSAKAAKLESEERNKERVDEIVKLTKLLRNAAAASELDALRAELENERATRATAEERLQERFREIAALTRLIQERDQMIDHAEEQSEWLRQVVSGLTRDLSRSWKGRLSSLLPARVKQANQRAWLKQQGLFDGDDYSSIYPDVAESSVEPLRHYINHGMKEGRLIKDPS